MARRTSIEPPAYETITFASTPSSVSTASRRRDSSSSADSSASSTRSDCSCPCNCATTTTTTTPKSLDSKQTTTAKQNQNQTLREKWRAMREEDRIYRASRVQYISKAEADRITGLERRREQDMKRGKKNINGQGFGYGLGIGPVYGQRYP